MQLNKNTKIYIAGHNGMVGSAIMRKLQSEGYENLVTRSFDELDLTRQEQVEKFFEEEKPKVVIIAAAKVGGILANNTYRAEFIYDNLMIEANIIHAAYKNKVEKLIFLGSSCIYPKFAQQPMKEEHLLTGELEQTNEPYAIAKIAGIKLCENYYKQYDCNYYSVMPTNLYGPNDNFNLETSHVLPALIRKFHEAKKKQKSEVRSQKSENAQNNVILNGPALGGGNEESHSSPPLPASAKLYSNEDGPITHSVTLWGTGTPKREFLYVEDFADAVVYLMNKIDAKDLYEQGLTHINIGTGEDLSIAELADTIKNIVGFEGEIKYDSTKPDGTPRKLMDVSRLHNLGWKHKTDLKTGIEKTYKWFLENYKIT